jgi:hypothetical protein
MTMTNWLSQFQQFWSSAQKTPLQAPVHEVLKRNDRFLSTYALWDKSQTIESLRQTYQMEMLGEKSSTFTRIDGPTAAGIQWQKPGILADADFDFLLEHCKDVLLSLSYVQHQADRRLFNRADVVEEVHRYYLKARISASEMTETMNQRWGNILLEVKREDGRVTGFKLQLNRYSDRMYQDALSLESLMELLLH